MGGFSILKTLLIGFLLALVVIIFILLIRKIFVGLVIFLLVLIVGFYGLNKYDIGVVDLVNITDLYEKADKLNNMVNLNKDEKELTINGEEFQLVVKKDDSGEYVFNGEAPVVSEKGVSAMLKMIDTTNKTLKVEEFWEDVKKYNIKEGNFNEVANESLGNAGGNIKNLIENPKQLSNMINNLDDNEVLILGNMNFKIEGDKIKVLNELSK